MELPPVTFVINNSDGEPIEITYSSDLMDGRSDSYIDDLMYSHCEVERILKQKVTNSESSLERFRQRLGFLLMLEYFKPTNQLDYYEDNKMINSNYLSMALISELNKDYCLASSKSNTQGSSAFFISQLLLETMVSKGSYKYKIKELSYTSHLAKSISNIYLKLADLDNDVADLWGVFSQFAQFSIYN